VDGMDNRVNHLYHAWPDRIFVVRSDGRLAVAASRGPWGYKPAIEATGAWLSELRKTGHEPSLPDDADAADASMTSRGDLVGSWDLTYQMTGTEDKITGTIVFSDDLLGMATIEGEDEPAKVSSVKLENYTISMIIHTPDDQIFTFSGATRAGGLWGTWTSPDGSESITCTGKKSPN